MRVNKKKKKKKPQGDEDEATVRLRLEIGGGFGARQRLRATEAATVACLGFFQLWLRLVGATRGLCRSEVRTETEMPVRCPERGEASCNSDVGNLPSGSKKT